MLGANPQLAGVLIKELIWNSTASPKSGQSTLPDFPQICSDLPNGLARCIFCARGEDASNGGSEFCDDHDHGRHENFPSSRHRTVAATLLQCSSALQELGILFVYADLACNEGWQCNDGVGGLFYSQLFLQCILLYL